MSLLARLRLYVELTRPFTLLPPLLGMLSGSLTALGALRQQQSFGATPGTTLLFDREVLLHLVLGAAFAAVMNAGSNVLNQWTDLENDRINKPARPLPSGRATVVETAALTAFFFALSLVTAYFIQPGGRHDTFLVACGGALASIVYSVPPLRTKRFGTAANVTIAIARGCLLKVCGWSCIAPVFGDLEPWYIGSVFALFLVGGAATKDFADLEGDRAAGCRTWPVELGPRRAARRVAPFLVVPWLLIPLGCLLPGTDRPRLLSGDPLILTVLAIGLAVYGIFIARSILRDADALARTENHPSWTHMYIQMMSAQIGLAAAYWV
jgi:geranylgeranylglycerol-phosphate geranylgeranyltransferase